MRLGSSIEASELLELVALAPRERATRIFRILQELLALPPAVRTQRLERLGAEMAAHPEYESIRSVLREFWSHHSYIRVLSEAGLPDESFFAGEVVSRAFQYFLPVDEVGGDLYVLIDSLRLKESDARWIASLPAPLVAQWAEVFRPSRASILASCRILSLRFSSVALSRDFVDFTDDSDMTNPSFFELPSVVEHVVEHPNDLNLWQQQRVDCEARIAALNQFLTDGGSSANLVFRLRLLRALLGRIQQVISLQSSEADARKLAVTIVHGFASQRRFSNVIAGSTRRLARSVVERTGRVGKRYIAGNAAEWRAMGLGAVVAGVITSFTALFKHALASAITAPMLLAIAHSLNYVISFLLMQAGHFMLASKMPAVTAATAVDAMEDPNQDHMAQLRAISQTQFVVTVGNLLGAIPFSIAVDRLIYLIWGHPFLSAEESEHGMRMLFPHASMTIPFAIATGVFLWLSSLATGWTANYLALHKTASAVSNSIRIRDRFGERRAAGLAHWILHHAPGSIGFVVLGCLLGTVPILCQLFGIPLEVRHVTLAAAALGYALDGSRIAGQLHWYDAALALVGIICVGLLNIFTSFALSFLLAIRARNVGDAKSLGFLRQVGREVLANPIAFLLPPRQ